MGQGSLTDQRRKVRIGKSGDEGSGREGSREEWSGVQGSGVQEYRVQGSGIHRSGEKMVVYSSSL